METQLNLATPSINLPVFPGMVANLINLSNAFVPDSFPSRKNTSPSYITYNVHNPINDSLGDIQGSQNKSSIHSSKNKDTNFLESVVRYYRAGEDNNIKTTTNSNSTENNVTNGSHDVTPTLPTTPINMTRTINDSLYNTTLVNNMWPSQIPRSANDHNSNSSSTAISSNYIIIFSTLFFLVGTIGITGNVLVVYIVLSDGKMRRNKSMISGVGQTPTESGQSLVIYEESRKTVGNNRSMTNMMILNLALADSLIMLFGIPEIVMFMMDKGWQLGGVACSVNRTILVCSLYASVLTLVAVSIERYIAIVFPIKAHILCTKKRVIFVIGFIWLLSSACSSPTAVFNSVVQMSNNNYCITKFHNNRSKHDIYLRVFKYSESVLFYMGPLVIQVVCYAVIGKRLFVDLDKLHRGGGGISSASRPNGRGRTRAFNEAVRARKGVVKMLMASVAIYFLSYSPHQILLIYRTFSSLTFDKTWMFYVFTTTLAYMNSAANPFLYCVFSDNFRKNFKRILHRCLPCVFCCGDCCGTCSPCLCCKDQKTQRPMTLHSYTEYTSLVRRNTPKQQGQSPIIAV